jgi:hypothetical protein
MASTVVTSNREPVEWLGQKANPLLAQSAVDRLLRTGARRQSPTANAKNPGSTPETINPEPDADAGLDHTTPSHHHLTTNVDRQSDPIPSRRLRDLDDRRPSSSCPRDEVPPVAPDPAPRGEGKLTLPSGYRETAARQPAAAWGPRSEDRPEGVD